MREQALFTLVRSALIAELPPEVKVLQKNQPSTVGVPTGPAVFMETIIPGQRVGVLGRKEKLKLGLEEFEHLEIQWIETTLQISALARRTPVESATLPSAADYCQTAASILQGDAGMKVLAAQRVRPLRVTTMRNTPFINDSQQYEANPSFDIVLSHVQIRTSTTPIVSELVGGAASI